MKLVRFNKYDYLITFFIVLQVFGVYGGGLQPIRLLTIACLPILLFWGKRQQLNKIYKYETRYLICFLLWGILSLLIVIDYKEAMTEIFYLFINICLFLTLALLSTKATNPKLSIILGWFLFCIVLLPISYFEIFHGFHLSSTVIEKDAMMGGTSNLVVYSSTTFGNYNLYVVMIIFAFPFISEYIFITKRLYFKIILYLILLFISYIVIVNGSRGGTFCILIGWVYFFIKNSRYNPGLFNRFSIFMIIGLIVFLGIKYQNMIFSTILYRFKTIGFNDRSRTEIYSALWETIKDTLFIGVGAGNLQTYLKQHFLIEIVAAHNLFLEILVQYGFFIFLGFIGLIIRIYKKVKDKDFLSKYVVYLSLLFFPIIAIINSTYLQGPNIWVFLACLFVFSQNFKPIIH